MEHFQVPGWNFHISALLRALLQALQAQLSHLCREEGIKTTPEYKPPSEWAGSEVSDNYMKSCTLSEPSKWRMSIATMSQWRLSLPGEEEEAAQTARTSPWASPQHRSCPKAGTAPQGTGLSAGASIGSTRFNQKSPVMIQTNPSLPNHTGDRIIQ